MCVRFLFAQEISGSSVVVHLDMDIYLPVAINYSAHVINPSYVLFAAILFFIGFFEAFPNFL